MTARIIETKRDELINSVVSKIWKDRYNYERLILDMIWEHISKLSDSELKRHVGTQSYTPLPNSVYSNKAKEEKPK